MIQKYFHFLPDYENDGFPTKIGDNSTTAIFKHLETLFGDNFIIGLFRNVFHTGESYIQGQNVLNHKIAIDGLYSAYYNFLKALISPHRFQPPSPLDPPPLSPKSYTKKLRNTKQVRDPSLTKKYRNQRASKFPDWWTKTDKSD